MTTGSAEVETSSSRTPSVSLSGNSEINQEPTQSSSSGEVPNSDTLLSVDPPDAVLGEPRFGKRCDRSPRTTNSVGNSFVERGNHSINSDQGSAGDLLDSTSPATADQLISLIDIP